MSEHCNIVPTEVPQRHVDIYRVTVEGLGRVPSPPEFGANVNYAGDGCVSSKGDGGFSDCTGLQVNVGLFLDK